MNATVRKALENGGNLDEVLTGLEIGEVVRVTEVWNEVGECPDGSYALSFWIVEDTYLTFWFDNLGDGYMRVTDITIG